MFYSHNIFISIILAHTLLLLAAEIIEVAMSTKTVKQQKQYKIDREVRALVTRPPVKERLIFQYV